MAIGLTDICEDGKTGKLRDKLVGAGLCWREADTSSKLREMVTKLGLSWFDFRWYNLP